MLVQEHPQPVEVLAATRVQYCYQCGNCSAGCPMAAEMDVLPNRLLRLVQMGRIDQAARSKAVWQCVSCQTCTTRCPQTVDCAGVMDVLREYSIVHGIASQEQQRTVAFQRAFLDNIRRNGRLNELELVAMFKTRAFLKDLSIPLLFKDALLGPKMMQRGKFHLRGEKVADRGIVSRIFDQCCR